MARSGSGSAATVAEQIPTRASALRCSGLGDSSSGTSGSLRTMRSTAFTTTRPSAAGRRPSNSSWRPSGSCHHEKLRSWLKVDRLRGGDSRELVALGLDGARRDPLGPGEKTALGLGGGEPGELHDLVHPEAARAEGLRGQGQGLQGVGGCDPAPRLPVGDAVAHLQPVGHVVGSVVLPHPTTVGLGDEGEEPPLLRADSNMARVHLGEERGVVGQGRGVVAGRGAG